MDAWPANLTTISGSEIDPQPEVVVVGLDLPRLPEPQIVEVQLPRVSASLFDQRLVHVLENLPLARFKQWVVGDRLRHPEGPALAVDDHVAERDQQGAGLAAELALEADRGRRTRSGLTVEPLRDRRLGDLQAAGKLPLRDAHLVDGSLERLSELLALVGVRGRLGHPQEATAKARAAFLAKFEREADPEGVLPPAERRRRAEAPRSEAPDWCSAGVPAATTTS